MWVDRVFDVTVHQMKITRQPFAADISCTCQLCVNICDFPRRRQSLMAEKCNYFELRRTNVDVLPNWQNKMILRKFHYLRNHSIFVRGWNDTSATYHPSTEKLHVSTTEDRSDFQKTFLDFFMCWLLTHLECAIIIPNFPITIEIRCESPVDTSFWTLLSYRELKKHANGPRRTAYEQLFHISSYRRVAPSVVSYVPHAIRYLLSWTNSMLELVFTFSMSRAMIVLVNRSRIGIECGGG